MNALRHPLLSVLLVLQLLYRYSTATVLLLRHGSSVGTHHTKNNNNNNHVPQQLQQQLPVSKQISKQKRRNIKNKKPKGSKYYHLENDNDDNDNDNNDDTVDVDMYNSTTDGKLSIPVSDSNNSTTTSNNTTNTIIVTSPSSSPPTTTTANTTTTTSSVDTSTRKSYGSSTATIKKQTMKKNMDPSKKDKLTKTKTMFTTSTGTTGSKGDHPTQSPQTESIDSNVKGDNRSKKGDTNKQMNPKGKKEHTYFVERTRTPTTTAPMIPVVSVPAPSTSVVQPHSNTGRTNRPTKVPTTITTFVPVAYNNSNLTFAPIPPPSTTTNTTTNDTTAVTTTTNTNTTTTSGRTNVTTTNARNGDESRHSNSSASVSAAAIVPDTYLDRTTGLFRHTADP